MIASITDKVNYRETKQSHPSCIWTWQLIKCITVLNVVAHL